MPALDWSGESAEMIVLSLLESGKSYGYAITKEVAARSGGQLKLSPGVLYPLLAGLEAEGLIASSWEEIKSERAAPEAEGRKRKWYRLTPKGKRRLGQRVASHRALRGVIDAFIGGEKEAAQ